MQPVNVRITDEVIPTYLPAPPDQHPMFLEKRVYQGSSGKVYPLPFTDRIAETKTDRAWKAIWLENEFLRVMILPEIGGRIHVAQDKTNGYDFIYRQTVIKPALVGLAGPWISGGIEFNWPQHHRPATFLPVEYAIEEHADGSKTVWLGDHDPMSRMKGMHGVCLRPNRAYIELKGRVYNRTPLAETFLWWANAATRVHEGYQSFFPPDVDYVADHAKRATARYPLCEGHYYGVDYGARGSDGVPPGERPKAFVPPHCGGQGNVSYEANDLSWYANIPVPTSYMCMGSEEDFFGGYDHFRQAGIVHVADHHIAPGKKQWTWGNHDFGYAWDRNLTDSDGPYIELMAGVYTDNQPDFSFLRPGETRSWSQYWYPIQQIGPAQHANVDAAVSLQLGSERFRIGVSVTAPRPGAVIRLESPDGDTEWEADLAPGKPFVLESTQDLPAWKVGKTLLRLLDNDGNELISYQPRERTPRPIAPPASEPPAPRDVSGNDELYFIGLHLAQYRHATRSPVDYWREAWNRDPGDSRVNDTMGLWHLRRGEFQQAEEHFRTAIARLTLRNPNPYDSEPHYHLGLCLQYQLDASMGQIQARGVSEGSNGEDPSLTRRAVFDDAYAALAKAAWSRNVAPAALLALAGMDCRQQDWDKALEHLDVSLRMDIDNTLARNLKAIVLRKLNRRQEAETLLRDTLARDPLDAWARHLLDRRTVADAQTRLDLAHDAARAGLNLEAIEVLQNGPLASDLLDGQLPTQSLGAGPLVDYTLGWLYERAGNEDAACKHYAQAAARPIAYCFPARLEEIAVLEAANRANPKDAHAPYLLGNLLYDRRRHKEAIRFWEESVKLDPTLSIAWRNLGIGYFNVLKKPEKARSAYDKAFRADPTSARVLYERDQLWKRLGVSPKKRLRQLQKHTDLVARRDDLSVELAALLNQTGRHTKALSVLCGRSFQPWEGGEGLALGQYVRSRLALGRAALAKKEPQKAVDQFRAALESPRNLGEAKHLLANQSDIHYWLGCALSAADDEPKARAHWRTAATFKGDFQEMRTRQFSEKTFYSALAWRQLGRTGKADALLKKLLDYARKLEKTPAKIDYFATSLPTMLLFDDDLNERQQTTTLFLQAQARLGLGEKAKARRLLKKVLARDPSHALAADLLAVH
jgi:tetratricopeptide (TPR) repeat protein